MEQEPSQTEGSLLCLVHYTSMFFLSGLFSLLITSINQLHFRQKLKFPYLETFLIFMQRPKDTVARFSTDEIQMSTFHVKKQEHISKNRRQCKEHAR